MLFNSFEFAVFLVIVFTLYWSVFGKNLRAQNIFLLVVSYIFYGWWDWRFVFLLSLSTFIDYFFGLLIYNSEKRKKFYLVLSIINNLGILAFFKYYNFFAVSAKDALSGLGFQINPSLLQIVLPVGISFYTFHGMSYVFDIYRNIAKPTKNFVDYALFVCFFPLLVAGPIERATHLLPEVQKKRNFDQSTATRGLRLILWGLFKKIAIADTLATYVNTIFANYHHYSGLSLIIGAIYFAIQIYCDFSGYTDIARGTARLFGFELLLNFRFPYFSRDIAEFWRRWHISLSSWFRDYLYIPLGGSRKGKIKAIRNTFIIFIVSGFWHGANWTFIIWGFIHALYFLPLLLLKVNKSNTGPIAANSLFPNFHDLMRMAFTFFLVCVAWIFFRAPTIQDAIQYLGSIFSSSFISGKEGFLVRPYLPFLIMFLFIVEWLSRNTDVEHFMGNIKKRYLRYTFYFFVVFLILMFGTFEETSFIYFQF